MAENSPYYESGVKISYTTPNNQWLLSALLLNGWQRIQRVQGNNTPAFGHQLTFKPNEKVTLNSSSFVGSDTPDSVRLMRYFHNFYLQLQCTKKRGLTLGFDAGAQQQTKGSQTFNSWYTYALIGKYAVFDKLAIAGRIEYYHDPRQVIVATGTQNGFQNYGFSLNTDYAIAENALWRIEGKQFYSKDPMFINNNKLVNNYFYITTSLALAF